MERLKREWKKLPDSELEKETQITQCLFEVVSSAAPTPNITLLKILCTDRLTSLRSEQAQRSQRRQSSRSTRV